MQSYVKRFNQFGHLFRENCKKQKSTRSQTCHHGFRNNGGQQLRLSFLKLFVDVKQVELLPFELQSKNKQ